MRHAILAAVLSTTLLAVPAAGQGEPHRSHPLATPTAAEVHWAGRAADSPAPTLVPVPRAASPALRGALLGGLVGFVAGALVNNAFGGGDTGCGTFCGSSRLVAFTAIGAFIGAMVALADAGPGP